MGGCCSSPSDVSDYGRVQAPAQAAPAQPVAAPKSSSFVANKPSAAKGDEAIPAARRVKFLLVLPEETGLPAMHLFFDKEKPVERVIQAAATYAGVKIDKGKLVGSPQRLNLFNLEGDIVRLDLEIEAHLGSTLRPGDVLILEKGNRMEDARLAAIKAAVKR